MRRDTSSDVRSRQASAVDSRCAGPCATRWLMLGAHVLVAASAVHGPTAPARGDESRQAQAERREQLEQMSDADKNLLLQKKKRFDELTSAEQERLRDLHRQLQQDPDNKSQLLPVLIRYNEWLRTLTLPERAEILSLPANHRLEKIKELTQIQESKRFRMMASGFKMDPRDLTIIHDWFDKFLDAHTQDILATLPDEHFTKLKKEYKPERDRVLLGRIYSQSMAPDLPRPSVEEERQLLAQVSPAAQEVLAKANDPQERSRIIRWWVGAAVLSRLRTNPSLEDLHQFAQESLSKEERYRLESLPADQMYRELRFLYNQRRFGADPGRGPFWGPRGGDRKPGGDGGPGFDGPPPPGGRGFPPPPWDAPGHPPRETPGPKGPPASDPTSPPAMPQTLPPSTDGARK